MGFIGPRRSVSPRMRDLEPRETQNDHAGDGNADTDSDSDAEPMPVNSPHGAVLAEVPMSQSRALGRAAKKAATPAPAPLAAATGIAAGPANGPAPRAPAPAGPSRTAGGAPSGRHAAPHAGPGRRAAPALVAAGQGGGRPARQATGAKPGRGRAAKRPRTDDGPAARHPPAAGPSRPDPADTAAGATWADMASAHAASTAAVDRVAGRPPAGPSVRQPTPAAPASPGKGKGKRKRDTTPKKTPAARRPPRPADDNDAPGSSG